MLLIDRPARIPTSAPPLPQNFHNSFPEPGYPVYPVTASLKKKMFLFYGVYLNYCNESEVTLWLC